MTQHRLVEGIETLIKYDFKIYLPNVTSITEMFKRCLVFGERRKNPYSREYSTIYFSSGHTGTGNIETSDTAQIGPQQILINLHKI